MKRTTGLVLGKFLPPHLGHVYLVDFARRYADDLIVVVGTLAAEPIPGALRHAWMRELFPDVTVLHLTDENPQHPHEHPAFWDIWRKSLLRILPKRPDLVFASEEYGPRLAEVLGAEFVPVDPRREAVPISGTAVRADPLGHWDALPACVRPYFVRRVCVFGAESTGKTTLCRALSARLRTVMVPEYARTYLERRGGAVALDDMPRIARGQAAAEDALARHARGVLICDTDVLATVLWSEALFNQCPEDVSQIAKSRASDLYLLTDPCVPWQADPVRYHAEQAQRAAFHERCVAALESRGRRFVRLGADPSRCLEEAIHAIEGIG